MTYSNIQEKIPIVMISDEKFIMPTCVAITSLIYNMNVTSKYDLFVIVTDCSEESLNRIKALETDRCKINLVNQSLKKYEDIKQLAHISTACLLKFDICDIISQYDKLIYLDGDIIVNADLSSLYLVELEDLYLGGVKELNCIDDNGERVNAGILLFNAKKIRDEGLSKKLIQMRRNLGDRGSMDQQTFNLLFQTKIKFLDIKYNCVPGLLIGEHKLSYPIDKINKNYNSLYVNKKEILKKAVILHFATSNKPWKYTFNPCADLWFHYYEISSFRDIPLIKRGRWGYRVDLIKRSMKEEGIKGWITLFKTGFNRRFVKVKNDKWE